MEPNRLAHLMFSKEAKAMLEPLVLEFLGKKIHKSFEEFRQKSLSAPFCAAVKMQNLKTFLHLRQTLFSVSPHVKKLN